MNSRDYNYQSSVASHQQSSNRQLPLQSHALNTSLIKKIQLDYIKMKRISWRDKIFFSGWSLPAAQARR
ncbi:hypothetical protein UPYG_G00201430 [Umbra pygmaea]|uniref:Uncharacterized protein n=1 Tax=Umbra pygmaea TaxID=75934 RepID=A0ABD0WIB0_UMBPY